MIEIRRASRADAQTAFDIRLLAIRNQCITAYTHEQMITWTKGSAESGYYRLMEKHFYLAFVQGTPTATGMLDSDSGEIGAIFVHPSFMGQGIGRKIMDFLERLACDVGIKELNLEATLNAADFYRRCGFTGDEQTVYHSPSGLQLACIPMVKTLGKL